MKNQMRHIACALILMAGPVTAAAPVPNFDPVAFEKRFNKADKDKNGKLSRTEAYAEFPRMPEFFEEIDFNKDGFITLTEVRRAVDKRVNAAMDASNPAKRFGGVDAGAGAGAAPPVTEQEPKRFSSQAEARRYYRNEYYESLADRAAIARERGEPVQTGPIGPVINKSF